MGLNPVPLIVLSERSSNPYYISWAMKSYYRLPRVGAGRERFVGAGRVELHPLAVHNMS